jgi:hypothetical protein
MLELSPPLPILLLLRVGGLSLLNTRAITSAVETGIYELNGELHNLYPLWKTSALNK